MKAQEAQVSSEEEEQMMKNLERKETEYMRLQRHKMGIDDFEQLTVIGKGAFGEVRLCRAKSTGEIFALKKLKKSDMLSCGQVEHVRSERNLLVEVDNRYWRFYIAESVLAIHSVHLHNYIHRNGHLKLSDFGWLV